jgi:hypothetical protein
MTPHHYFCTLTDELTEHTAQVSSTPKGKQLLKLLGTRINGLFHPTPISDEQRVDNFCQQEARNAQQRVINDSPILTVPCLTGRHWVRGKKRGKGLLGPQFFLVGYVLSP